MTIKQTKQIYKGHIMSIELKKLKEERAEVVHSMHTMVKTAEDEKRGLTTEEDGQWSEMSDSVDSFDARIEKVERSNSLMGQLDDYNDDTSKKPDLSEQREHEDESVDERSEAFGALIRSVEGGTSGLSTDQRKVLAEMRAQSVGTTTAGGYTVPEGFEAQIIESMVAFGGIANVANVLNTATGNDLPFITNDDTGNSGALLAENTQDSEQDLTLGQITLGAYKYTSKIIRVSNELIQDNAVNLESYIAKKFGERLGRITSAHYATGTGTAQPNGLMTAATVGKTAASATALTYDELLDLKHSVDPAYRGNARWAFNDSTFKAIKQLKDSQNRPLWMPDYVNGAAGTIDGDQYVIDQGIASMAINALAAAYGDMDNYQIRMVQGFQMVRLVERYADFHQVGFLAFMRTDADLLDTAAVKSLKMAAA